MDIGSLFLILALLILVVLFISRPFYERRSAIEFSTVSGEEEHELSALLAERDRLLNALQELDFDHVLGKIPDEEYPIQRAFLLQHGAEVLRELDAYQAEAPQNDAEDRIEAAIAARRADARRSSAGNQEGYSSAQAATRLASIDDDLETLLANRRRARQGKSAGFCPQCGGPVQKSDRFCPKCGTTLA